jgi:hypothetical protein
VAEYTYRFTGPGFWTVINGTQASALAMGAGGDIAATFPGFGVGHFLPGSGWTLLTAASTALLAVDAGDVAGAFGGLGVWEYDPTRGWIMITAATASALAMA